MRPPRISGVALSTFTAEGSEHDRPHQLPYWPCRACGLCPASCVAGRGCGMSNLVLRMIQSGCIAVGALPRNFSGDGSNWPPPASRVRLPGPRLGGQNDKVRMEIFKTCKSVGAVRRGIFSTCDVVRPDTDVHVHQLTREGTMVSAWWLASIPFVFLVGFFLACAFALADIRQLKAEIKRLQEAGREAGY